MCRDFLGYGSLGYYSLQHKGDKAKCVLLSTHSIDCVASKKKAKLVPGDGHRTNLIMGGTDTIQSQKDNLLKVADKANAKHHVGPEH